MAGLVIVGAGAAGLSAAIAAGEADPAAGPVLLEKNDRPGVKLLISGGGRCNVTADASAREVVQAFGPSGRFLHNALGACPPEAVRRWLAEEGVSTHVEPPDRKVFPDSGKARDVVEALLRRARRAGADLRTGCAVTSIARDGGGWRLETTKGALPAVRVVLATGGRSYPGTGTTGDAYAWLAALGHRIVPTGPVLVPWRVALPWVHALSGLTLEDALVTLDIPGRPSACGGFLFTHEGVSGPGPMNLSRHVPRDGRPSYRLLLDPLPAMRTGELAMRLKVIGLRGLLPVRLAEALAGLLPPGPPAQWRREALAEAARGLKAVSLEPAEPMGFDKAEVTRGGVALEQVDPRTMASRQAPGLFLAGEILDLDGPIGGYNLAAAWATGWVAGKRGGKFIDNKVV